MIKDIKGPSTKSTSAWVDKMKDYLEPGTILIVDNLGGHHSTEVKTGLEEIGVSPEYMPSSAGKYLNPCDNSLHSILRRNYLKKQKQPHVVKMQSIVDAYYEIDSKSIVNCFEFTGITSSMKPKNIVERLTNDGYRYSGEKGEHFEKMKAAFLAWEKGLRFPFPSNAKSNNKL